jgi:quinol monooxygenase YgiN
MSCAAWPRILCSPARDSGILAAMTAVLTVLARLRAAPGKGDALAALLTEQAGVIRESEPGCLVYRPHRSTADPDLFIFYEMYEDDAAFDLHRKSPHLAAYRQRREREGLLEGSVDVQVFRALTD